MAKVTVELDDVRQRIIDLADNFGQGAAKLDVKSIKVEKDKASQNVHWLSLNLKIRISGVKKPGEPGTGLVKKKATRKK